MQVHNSNPILNPIPWTNTNLACRAFSIAAQIICNSLPVDVRLCDRTAAFK